MKKEWLVKQLMAKGFSRNDANAFVKVHRKIKQTGIDRELQLKMMLEPEDIAPRTSHVHPERLRAKQVIDKYERDYRQGIDWDTYMEDRLLKDMARRLKDSGLVKFFKRDTPLWTEFYAEVTVLPAESEGVTVQWH